MSRPQAIKKRGRHKRTGRPVNARTPKRDRHVGICASTGKRQYLDKGTAKTVGRDTGPDVHPYRCNACGYIHLGTHGGRPRAVHRAIHANDPTHLEVALGGAPW